MPELTPSLCLPFHHNHPRTRTRARMTKCENKNKVLIMIDDVQEMRYLMAPFVK